jgi:putative transposase
MWWRLLEELTSLYPAPAFICSDNGPEFIAHALRRWTEGNGTSTAYIEPGSSCQNGFCLVSIRFKGGVNLVDR